MSGYEDEDIVNRQRWVVENHTLKFKDGTEFKLPSWTPPEVEEHLATLPADYVELGMAGSDLAVALAGATRQQLALEEELAALQAKVAAGEDQTKAQAVMTILQMDLETALNMVRRFAFALGVQPGGDLYDEIQALLTKYKMFYQAPKDYSYEENVRPTLDVAGTRKALPEGEDG